MQLKGKVAIVTGGGSGIGRAIGVGLAGEGASVVVADIDSNSADAVAAELEELGRTRWPLQLMYPSRTRSMPWLRPRWNASGG